MATIERRVRNGKTTYRARYRDPAGRQRSKVFARKADAQRFLNETETAKARGTWTDPALGRVLFRDWLGEWWADHHQPAAQDPGPGRAAAATPGPAELRGCSAGGDQPTGRAHVGG
jgi:hypothetical protein